MVVNIKEYSYDWTGFNKIDNRASFENISTQ